MCVKGVLILLFIAMLSRPAAGGGRETRAVASTETETDDSTPEQKPDDDNAESHMKFFEEMKKSAEDTSIKVGVELEQ